MRVLNTRHQKNHLQCIKYAAWTIQSSVDGGGDTLMVTNLDVGFWRGICCTEVYELEPVNAHAPETCADLPVNVEKVRRLS